ncbi:MAG: hypothetical protein ACE5SW_10665 [Nitrososphaeraceae archaeon]
MENQYIINLEVVDPDPTPNPEPKPEEPEPNPTDNGLGGTV